MSSDDHKQKCLNDALHKKQVAETQLRIMRRLLTLEYDLNRLPSDRQLPLLHRLEAAIKETVG
jgi:hypothetical protein